MVFTETTRLNKQYLTRYRGSKISRNDPLKSRMDFNKTLDSKKKCTEQHILTTLLRQAQTSIKMRNYSLKKVTSSKYLGNGFWYKIFVEKGQFHLASIYSWIGQEGQFLKTDCPYKHTFSKKILSLAENSKLSL